MTVQKYLTKINQQVLVVDDDPVVLDILFQYMKMIDLEVVCVNSGERALEEFKKGGFDLVISDIKMANMDGLKLLSAIKRIDYDVPVIIITGYPTIETVIEAMKNGAIDYLVKPFQFDEIKLKIERALAEKEMSKQLKSNKGIIWSLIISIPVWLILGIILANILMK